jgi:hypothetical protein
LLVIGTTLLVRTQVQGLEAALLATAVEYGFRGMRAGSSQRIALDGLSDWRMNRKLFANDR